jgi:hypothetical protein
LSTSIRSKAVAERAAWDFMAAEAGRRRATRGCPPPGGRARARPESLSAGCRCPGRRAGM